METIDVRGLRMRYGATDVLHDVSFTTGSGEVLALLGPNGAGKTTTIEILEGFRIRSAGTVAVLGVDPARGDEVWRAKLGVVLQSWRDHGKWRVRELLAHLGRYYADPWDADELIELVGLSDRADHKIKTLSGGQRRRLDVAIGIVGRPELLFLDEPTTGFDPVARHAFHALVRRLATELHTTILLTTHDLDEASKLADRILILADGRVLASGTPDELTRQIAGRDEVRWRVGGTPYVELTGESTAFARELFTRYGEAVSDLEVRRARLEDAYLALVGGDR
ncbi:ABC transporter ATP-binding protein [Kribbella italica]|uniref:ABC-2 type transport system ATP-binding protein n=1 Tax=Kribbella italica TaxID=1540520 RepID=A0A7W9JG77_9ACTN|nr:ABC transporter ATP-binding protein [Kribbella italica]MBB5841523.1 ABC-2 type transport system ATP-binding protein [Kribbella italica]